MLKRQEGEESKSLYADSFPGWGSFLLALFLLSLVSVCTHEDLLLLDGHFHLLLHLNFHPMVTPAHSHVLNSVLENGKAFKSLSLIQSV